MNENRAFVTFIATVALAITTVLSILIITVGKTNVEREKTEQSKYKWKSDSLRYTIQWKEQPQIK